VCEKKVSEGEVRRDRENTATEAVGRRREVAGAVVADRGRTREEKELGGGFRFCAGDYVVEGCPR